MNFEGFFDFKKDQTELKSLFVTFQSLMGILKSNRVVLVLGIETGEL
jgi:hypothetical protein